MPFILINSHSTTSHHKPLLINPKMSSSNNQKPKFSRVAKISVKPVWRRKLDSCQQTNDVASNQPTSKPHSHTNNSSQNNNPNIIVETPHITNSTNTTSKMLLTNEDSLSSTPPPHFYDYPNNTTLLTQQDNLTITLTNKVPQPSHPSLPNDPFEEHAQSTNNNHHSQQNMNSMPTTPSSPSTEHIKFVDELKEAHELNALLALHLTQRNLDHQPTSTNSSPSNNLVHLENHVNNCICCTYLEKQNFVIKEHLTWIEYLLTKATPNPPPPNTPYPSPSNN